jgi:hypothetical protein
MRKRFDWKKYTDNIDVRVDPTLKELIGDIAFEEGLRISDFVRTLLILEVERRKERPNDRFNGPVKWMQGINISGSSVCNPNGKNKGAPVGQKNSCPGVINSIIFPLLLIIDPVRQFNDIFLKI